LTQILKPIHNANRSKQIIYEKIIFASVLNVPSGGLLDKTISSSILNPIGLIIVPFVSKAGTSTLLSTALGFCQYESPWDTAPSTNGPLSLTDISVSLGGKKIANEVLNYTYENFLHQVSLAETLTSTDIGLKLWSYQSRILGEWLSCLLHGPCTLS
jgi:hypothetical protein